ncbi:MAG: HEAT repeat domain-containing protein [Planctomycetota bacterium]
MRIVTCLLWGLSALAIGGCVAQEPTRDRETPEFIQQQIDFLMARIPHEEGQALYDDLRRLAAHGSYAVPALLEALEDPNPQVRGAAAFTLGDIDDERASAALQDALEDREPLVRYEAARSLLYQGDWTGIPALIEGLRSSNPSIRLQCHDALRAETLQDFGYPVEGDETRREEAAKKWEAWWRALEEERS